MIFRVRRCATAPLCHLQHRFAKNFRKRVTPGAGIYGLGELSPVVHHGVRHQVALGREVPKKGTPGYACRLRNVVDGGLVEPLFREQAGGGIPDGVAYELLFTGLQRGKDSRRVRRRLARS